MTVHIVPVGLSIQDGLGSSRGSPSDATSRTNARRLLDRLIAKFAINRHRAIAALLATPRTELFTELSGLLSPWNAKVSAEVSSLAKCEPLLDASNGVVLVATDTDEGLMCAALNAIRMKPTLARYVDSPAALHDVLGAVTVVRIPGMDIANTDFTRAMRHLGELARILHDMSTMQVPPQEFEFHLSGGYKAAMPYFLAVAEGMRSLYNGTRVRANCMHENSDALIRVPLRFFPDTFRSAMIAELTNVCEGLDPDTRGLEGYGYEFCQSEVRFELTAIGHGLLSLLPDRDSHSQDLRGNAE